MALKDSFGAYDSKTNGPVPTGFDFSASSVSLAASHVGEAIRPIWPARNSGNVAHGRVMVTSTASGSLALTAMLVTSARAVPVRKPFLARVRLSTTAAPSSGVPSWNVMSGRTLMVQTVLSAFGMTLSARYGSQLGSESVITVSGSYTLKVTW